jgi:CBS domain-containing protein
MPVTEAMTRAPVIMTANGSAIEALRAMNDGGFRHLPVIEGGSIVGVVSRTDFTGVEIDRLEEEEVIW